MRFNDDADLKKDAVKDVPFTTVANLITALLTELKRNYIVSQDLRDKKMRKRINKTIDIVNN